MAPDLTIARPMPYPAVLASTAAHTLAGMAVVINMVALKEQVGIDADRSDHEAMLRVAVTLQRMARRAHQ